MLQRNGEDVCIPLRGEDSSGVTCEQAGVLGAESFCVHSPLPPSLFRLVHNVWGWGSSEQYPAEF